ncbi:MAG TPA: hypothetical protein VG871_14655, partial [Vicinamibacterales bacterium]|nr:hypothetical protein [Vicinamibacterales bacterium]
MLKTLGCIALAGACLLGAPSPARAQQTLNFSLGYFAVRGEDARTTGDQIAFDRNFLSFNVSDFNGATIGGEWLIPIGDFFEGGAGVSFSRRTVPSVYTNYTDNTGAEIEQRLRLRIVPVSFTFRVLPLGQTSPVQPYFGAGVGIFNWRYSESGDFIDFSKAGNPVYNASYVGTGTNAGPVALGGIRVAGDSASAGFEIRYQKAMGDLPTSDFFDPANP